ncbi:putative heme-dependent peroxidase [Agromyces sp. NDB4Y10]|uniref:hydrogen peroxide-dependent heme synthase n=1 Tax=Agromyces sp. NDB4Y10 TaxID=1775951 RepID=UPI0007B19AD2|nr:hydrogen peroxide-dependent heme synthase [Agromyces sp. NDB4Y10]KZE93933.1 putative heme-dependent peroxidase [Agromyces sp. NDB4Y10]
MSSPAAEGAADAPRPETADEQTYEGYTLFAVLRKDPARPDDLDGRDVPRFVDELDGVINLVQDEGVVVRGIYDVSGLRADADVMVWLHGPTAEGLQWALRELRRARLFRALLPTWNAMGVHRDAEFNKAHVPGFLRGVEPRAWLTIYPFVRSYEWYLLPPEERGRMLAEHGRKGAAFRGVIANTVSAFSLGDYEWLLPMESDELTDLVDMMRDLRATDARRHVRDELPFYTGRRITTAELVEVLQ